MRKVSVAKNFQKDPFDWYFTLISRSAHFCMANETVWPEQVMAEKFELDVTRLTIQDMFVVRACMRMDVCAGHTAHPNHPATHT